MDWVVLTVLLTCGTMIALVLIKPTVDLGGHTVGVYWTVPTAGAILLTVAGAVTPGELIAGMTAADAVNPLKILILFLSMTLMSVYLDEAGFFRYLAHVALKYAHSRQEVLFLLLYVTVSVLTVFTSNDIIILTFTPFICHFTKNAKIDPIPYLFAEFVAANTWSMALIIGNPTNIYLSSSYGIGFMEYASVMLLPALLAGLTAPAVLYLIFRRRLSHRLELPEEAVEPCDRTAVTIGLLHLGICTVLLTISSYIGFEMWLITLAFAASLMVCATVYSVCRKKHAVGVFGCMKRIPWALIPFVLSMFVLVMALNRDGVTARLAEWLGGGSVILRYGVASFAAANLINNIPMSVLFSSVAEAGAASAEAVYASVIGSNVCALFTPVGALAGIMWSGILKKHGVKFTFLTFVKYGALTALPTLFAALAGLALTVT